MAFEDGNAWGPKANDDGGAMPITIEALALVTKSSERSILNAFQQNSDYSREAYRPRRGVSRRNRRSSELPTVILLDASIRVFDGNAAYPLNKGSMAFRAVILTILLWSWRAGMRAFERRV